MRVLATFALASASFALLTGTSLAADMPDFSGHWQVNEGKSHFENEKTLSLDIQQQGAQMTFVRTYLNNRGKEENARFTCAIDGKDCELTNGGNKAKIGLWLDGPVLNVLKTDGEKQDSTVEWRLKLADDHKSMTADREIMVPNDKVEKLSFDKVNSVATR